MKTISVREMPPNMPLTVDRESSTLGERLVMWLLGGALLAVCLVAASVALA